LVREIRFFFGGGRWVKKFKIEQTQLQTRIRLYLLVSEGRSL
jgi:hypothetical protein